MAKSAFVIVARPPRYPEDISVDGTWEDIIIDREGDALLNNQARQRLEQARVGSVTRDVCNNPSFN